MSPSKSQAPKPLSRFLTALHARPRWSWAALLLYAVTVTLPHERVQAACSALAVKITHQAVYRISAGLALVELAAVTWFLARSLAGLPRRRRVLGLWTLTFLLVALAWRVLTANNLELVHYAQYFPEGLALTAITLSPVEALCWVVIFGGLDEGYQYWVLSKGLSTVFDFNDIYMDLLGGAAGVVFSLAFLRIQRTRRIVAHWRAGVVTLLGICAGGLLLGAAGLMLTVEDHTDRFYWFALGRFRASSFWVQIVTNGPYKYHTLTPPEGVALILGTVAVYAVILRKYVVSCAT
ncbi:MAG TPA: hypothetical protein VG456_10720 [Candidatus Sulfopaludibacter sp.]|nr:hypothetical protein [Candidatus Sulfopaludibacter sp.]